VTVASRTGDGEVVEAGLATSTVTPALTSIAIAATGGAAASSDTDATPAIVAARASNSQLSGQPSQEHLVLRPVGSGSCDGGTGGC